MPYDLREAHVRSRVGLPEVRSKQLVSPPESQIMRMMNAPTSAARLTWEPLTLHLHSPFRVSYGASETREVFWLRLANDEGWGESAIPPYYGISTPSITAFWETVARRVDPWPDRVEEVAAWVGEDGPAPARCALDLALHDRIAQRQRAPLYKLLGLPRPPLLPTSFTISIAAPPEMARMAAQAAAYPILKLKLGGEDDVACVAAVRAARPDARLRVDANAAWTPEEAVRRLRVLAPYHLDLVEQPVARDDIAGLGFVQAHTDLPVIADESLQTLADVERLAQAGVRGINLKLNKVGGLAPALVIAQRARALGLQIMLGCMIETSLGVTAMLHLAGLADWLDLDAPLLISNDPFTGAWYDGTGSMHLPEAPGIGVVRKDDYVMRNT